MATTVPRLRKAIKQKPPGLHIERELWERGSDAVPKDGVVLVELDVGTRDFGPRHD